MTPEAVEQGSSLNATLAESLEAVLDQLALRLFPTFVFSAAESSVVAQVHRPPTLELLANGFNVLESNELNSSNISLLLTPSLFQNYNTSILGTISGIWYREPGLFLTNATLLQNSIFSIRVPGLPTNTLDLGVDAVELRLPKPLNLSADTVPSCSYWSFTLKDWQSEGCSTNTTDTHVVCRCRHLTNFAVIVTLRSSTSDNDDVNSDGPSPISSADSQRLSTISYTGVSLSCCTLLLLEVALITAWPRLRSYQQLMVILNPVLAASQLLFVLGAGQPSASGDVSQTCRVTAATLHFLLLLTFALFFCEAIELYYQLVVVLGTNVMARLRRYTVGSIVFASAVVLVGGLLFPDDYGTSDFCWIKRESTASYLLWVPMATIVLLNSIIMILALRGAIKGGSGPDTRSQDKMRTLVLGMLAFSTLLGLGWAAGLLAVLLDSVALQYVFAIFTTFQGVLIFYFFFLRDKGFRRFMMARWCLSADERRRTAPRGTQAGGFADMMKDSSWRRGAGSSRPMLAKDSRRSSKTSENVKVAQDLDVVIPFRSLSTSIANTDASILQALGPSEYLETSNLDVVAVPDH
jgi:hypothetical protein